jgi:hypothetical protein
VAAPIEDEERKGKYPNKKRDGREIGQIERAKGFCPEFAER